MQKTVVIDCFPESIQLYRKGYAVVAVDVIRATTTAVTAAALGRRCLAVASAEAAFALAAKLDNPLLVGELGGDMPRGFEMNNSPALLERRADLARPVILLSSSGSKLIEATGECENGYVACFRNFASVANHLLRYPQVAVIGARSRGEFREEDQMCCAWIAGRLLDEGYQAENPATTDIVEHWRGVPASACADGHSALYLKRSGQAEDLDFVLTHINDLDAVCSVRDGEVVMVARECTEDSGMPAAVSGAGPRPIVSA
jgi:2-phosphosulfolactate phosphatase